MIGWSFLEKNLRLSSMAIVAWIVLGIITSLLYSWLREHYFTKI